MAEDQNIHDIYVRFIHSDHKYFLGMLSFVGITANGFQALKIQSENLKAKVSIVS